MKLEILSSDVTERRVTPRESEPFTVREQPAAWHLEGLKYPIQFPLRLTRENVNGYEPGMYEVDEAKSFGLGNFERPQVGFGGLVPGRRLDPVRQVATAGK